MIARAALALVLAACSTPSGELHGRVVVAVTMDWEGAYISDDSTAALAALRAKLGPIPLTHFMSAAYLTNGTDRDDFLALVPTAVRPGDEVAVHVHLWRSLVQASGVEARTGRSFLSGTEQLLEFDHGDVGFDLDPDAHTVAELRAVLRNSRKLLVDGHLTVSNSFRAGGYLATPKLMLALRSEGFTTDSSAVDARQLDELADSALPARLAKLWPDVGPPVVVGPPAAMVELPIAAVSDYASVSEIVGVLERAHAALIRNPNRDVFVVLACHYETAPTEAGRLGDAVATVRKKLGGDALFTTVESAAELVRLSAAP